MLCITQKGQMNFPNTKYFFSIWDPYSLWSNNNLNNESSFCNIVWWIQYSWGVAISIQILMRRKLCYVENWVMAVRNSTQTSSPQMKGEQKSSFPCSEVHTHCIRQSWLYKVRDLKQNQGPSVNKQQDMEITETTSSSLRVLHFKARYLVSITNQEVHI